MNANDDISLTELRSFAGDDDYPRKWLDYVQGQSRLCGFNPWAAIFSLAWFVYRRLYVQGLVSLVLEILVPVMIVAVAAVAGASEQVAFGFVLPLALFAVRIAFGFWGNLALCKKAVRTIREVDAQNLDNELHLQVIAANGRVNLGAFFIAFGVLGFADRFLIMGSPPLY